MSVRLRLALATGLVVLVALGLFEVWFYADLQSGDLLGRVVLGAVAAGVAAVLAAWVVGVRVLRPLTSIVEAAAQLARGGDFSRRLAPRTRDPEVLQLTHTFNQLIARVDELLTAQRQLLADTSHELRTPLTTVRGNLELLERELPQGERAEVLSETREEVDRMARLVRELLQLAAPPLEYVPVRLDVLVREVVDRVAGSEAARVSVIDEPVTVSGDEDRLRQLVGNLIDNAVRHAVSSIEVRVERRPPDALIVVEDDGPGIPAHALERIFDRFYRVDRGRARAQGGSGLGLAIVRHVAEAHGGRAWAENREAAPGARFSVQLPAEPSWVAAD